MQQSLSDTVTETPSSKMLVGNICHYSFSIDNHIDPDTLEEIVLSKSEFSTNLQAKAYEYGARHATSVGALHGMAHRHINDYQTILRKLNSNASIWQNGLKELLLKISVVPVKFDISLSSPLKQEINDVFKIMKEPGPFTTLINRDICPDNVFDDPANNQMHIIDFEWSFIANALLDGVYLRMCMPTCWCPKAFPEEVIDTCELIYRKELIKNIPVAKNDKEYINLITLLALK